MQKLNKQTNGICPVNYALDIFGDKWSLLILRDIVFKNKKYYGEFLTSPEKISTNILANRLLKMESEGLLSKTQDTQNLSKFVYQLTSKGQDLIPVLLDLIEWGAKYDPQENVSSDIIKGAPLHLLTRLHQEREQLIDEITKNINQDLNVDCK